MLRVLAVLLCLVPPAAAAQTHRPNPSLIAFSNGIRSEAHARSIQLRRFDFSVDLRGGIAETRVTATFANDSAEVLEGEFRLALPADAVVTGYALDIGGNLIDGVLVERPKAEAVYEAAVRRGVDPGLAEVGPEGGFTTRVFPIPAKGARTIRVTYVAPVFNAHRGEDVFVTPLDLAAPRDGWSIRVRASGVTAAPSLTWPGRAPIAMAREGDGFVAREEGTRALNGPLILGTPTLAEALASRNAMGETYLQLSGTLAGLPAAQRGGRVRVYWDRSRGRLGDHADELALLRRTLGALRPQSIDVVTFNSSGVERRTVADAEAAMAWLRNVRYRGASSFQPLLAEKEPADRCLLFSNGKPSIDRAVEVQLPCRLDTITGAAQADMAWLRHLAVRHGGRAFRLGDDVGAVVRALTSAAPAVRAVFDDQGRRLPFVPLEAAADRWLVAVRAPDSGGVHVQVAGSTVRRAVPAPAAFAGEGVLLAADTLATLGASERRADYVALSRRYGIASPSLSFLVLETPGDYVEADVAPPSSYPKSAFADYRRLRKDADVEAAEAKRERLDAVVKSWGEQVTWWKRRFDPAPPGKRRPRDVAGLPEPAMAPAPAPAYEPAPSPAPSAEPLSRAPGVTASMEEADGGDQAIVVSGVRAVPTTTIEIDAWQPDRPYLKAFDAAPKQFDALFAEQEKVHGTLPAFYLDTAEWLRRRGRTADAAEVLLSALDLPSANEVTLGIVAMRLERYGVLDRAVELRERYAALDTSRPQPKRFLALALARRAAAQPQRARADLERAVALLGDVALTPWDGAWDGVELITLMEANALIPKLRALGGDTDLDRRLIVLLDADIRVVADWTTNATDLDLWVDEPSGERAIYNNPRTGTGGHLSNDMTSGYGPEEYFLRRAPAGTYTVRADVYAGDRIDPNGASIVTVRLIRDFGRPTEREEAVDIEVVGKDDDEKLVGRIVVPKR